MKIIKQILHTISLCIYIIVNTIKTIIAILTAFIIGLIICSIIIYVKVKPTLEESRQVVFDKLSQLENNSLIPISDTVIYDASNNELGRISVSNFEYKDIQNINPKLVNTYIAVEDKRFKQHMGIDFLATSRAVVSLLKHRGKITQGGSSITQQVIKNMLLTNERSYKRKITELLLAPYIDTRLGKDKIMELYCNTNYYANNCYGIESASKFYFNKSNTELSDDEIAMIVGLSNSPNNYDPIKHKDKAIEKRNKVLLTMKEQNLISDDEYNADIKKDIQVFGQKQNKTKETYATTYALRSATLALLKEQNFSFKYTFKTKEEYDNYKQSYKEAYNATYNDLRNGGYDITVSLDNNLQPQIQDILNNNLSSFTDIDPQTNKLAFQGAVVVINNSTHQVSAIIGGRNDDEFNRAYLSVRQPGSTIKPLLDYGPAIDTGKYQENSMINDKFEEGKPKNSGDHYYGEITIKDALPRSLNTVAYSLLNNIGIDVGISYLDKLQFKNLSYIDSNSMSMALGGFTYGATVVDMATAYETFANDGIYYDTQYVTSIKKDNKELLTKENIPVKVYDANTSYIITDMLKDVIEKPYGTGYELNIPNQIVAGKTGTTNENKDGWFVGYSKYYTVAVWTGYDNPKPMPGIYGKTYSGKIWKDVMTLLHQNLPTLDFDKPNNIEETNGYILTTDIAEKKLKLNGSQNQNNEYKVIETEVNEYEQYQFSSIDDVINFDTKYQNLKSKIELINDDSLRSQLLARLEMKTNILKADIPNWQAKIDEYNNAKTKEKQIKQEQLKVENEKKQQKALEKIKISNFENALNALKNLQFKLDTDTFNQINNQILQCLEELKPLPDYERYNSDYRNTLDKYNSLKSITDIQDEPSSEYDDYTIEYEYTPDYNYNE